MLPNPQTRFVIIASERTGSNLLLSLLNSHPSIRTKGEVIGESRLRQKEIHAQILTCGCCRYIRNCFKQHNLEQAVGTKILYHQFRKWYANRWQIEGLNQALECLRGDTQIKIIHLKRRNRLKTMASGIIALQTKKYVKTISNEKEQEMQIELPKEKCEEFFGKIGEVEQEFDGYFQGHDKIEVYYEDLVSNNESVHEKILDFLGVNRLDLKAKTLKQRKKPLSETIRNYGELKSYFSATIWEPFFED